MAAKGQAAKSASGASMSRYDVEVEARLKKLEAEVRALQTHEHTSSAAAGGDAGARLQKLIDALQNVSQVTDNFPKGADGKRRIDI